MARAAARYLAACCQIAASSMDPLSFSQAQAESFPASPTDIDTIEYFASPDDICRAFAGLQQLAAQPRAGLSDRAAALSPSALAWIAGNCPGHFRADPVTPA